MELRLAWMCGEHLLPEAGGVLDQDYRTVHLMRVYRNTFNTIQRLRGMVGDQIHGLTDLERRMVRWLQDMGLL